LLRGVEVADGFGLANRLAITSGDGFPQACSENGTRITLLLQVLDDGVERCPAYAGPFSTVLPQMLCGGPRTWFSRSGFVPERQVRDIIFPIGGTCMRIFGFLVVLLCGLVSVCAASDPLRQSSSPPAVATSDSVLFNDGAGIVRPDFSGLAVNDRADRDDRSLDPARDEDLTCYTIESYRVKRRSRGSDVTEPVGYSTCQRASKYGVKKADELGKASSR
jgi:hypothetical protein